MQDYSVDALEDAAIYYRDKANTLSRKVNRDENGVCFSSFEDLNAQAGEGFHYLTYERGYAIFSGDTLFAGSIGRTDFPGGSMAEMFRSLQRLAALEGDFAVYPGHGPATKLSQERQYNPYMP